MMLQQILLGIFVSLSFAFGAILYKFTREEVDAFLTKFLPNKNFSKLTYVSAFVLGAILAYGTKTSYSDAISISVFAVATALSSFTLRSPDKRKLFKHVLGNIIVFLLAYLAAVGILTFG